MNEKPKISVIVPVYNVSEWLQKFYDSLTAQTLTDYEVLIVDDGSADDSGSICDEFAKKDARFSVMHQKNSGAAAARNAALPLAKGEYVYFMDPDDWCEPTMLEDMYRMAKKHNLQMVITGFYNDIYYKRDKFYTELRNAPNKIYGSQQEFRENFHKLLNASIMYNPWNKLYERAYINEHNLKFEDTFWDDFIFILDFIKDVERVGSSPKKYYHFVHARPESETAKYRKDLYEKREDENKRIRGLYKYWCVTSPEIEEVLDRRYAERLVGCIENLTNKNCELSKPEVKAQIKKILADAHTNAAIRNTKPNTLMMRLMLFPLKHKMVNLSYTECKFISFVKCNNLKLFSILKANR